MHQIGTSHLVLTLLDFLIPIVLSWLSPRASYRMVNAALAARDQEVFPLSFGAA